MALLIGTGGWVRICGLVLSLVSSVCSLLETGTGARDSEWTALPIDQEHVPDSYSLEETRKKEQSEHEDDRRVALSPWPRTWAVGQAAAVRVVTCNYPCRIEFGGGGGQRGPVGSEWHPLRNGTALAALLAFARTRVASDQIASGSDTCRCGMRSEGSTVLQWMNGWQGES
ncbi:hypothetical protein E2562_019412 [Oryza meyeriana var. granulata]|uniref:Secreted protein n=1 Tax=Oryza meyeriana var. granulata TaxID=110450 RepID=A0A6G1DKT1_9ORYZ|nr:hypothetical protein E2562_019412 [Oryza meyeriana var. granulata]